MLILNNNRKWFTLPYVEIHVQWLGDSPKVDSICDDNCENVVNDDQYDDTPYILKKERSKVDIF